MPTYEYDCAKCHHQFELVQPIANQALKVCPKDKCGMKRWGKGKVKRAISTGGGLIFKGSGFYITDYRSDSYKQAAKQESLVATSSGGGAKPAGAKTEAKPASKPEAKAPKAKAEGK